jgi:deazaflavin-dependent oxidoreductase (nitroreductase family)
MPNIRWLLALITAVHRSVYLSTRGRIGHRARRYRFLLLGSRGRRSGRERVVPLLYVRDGERFVVVGSNAGDPRDPAWWANLKAQPEGWVQVGAERFRVRAREASPEEAQSAWPLLIAAYGRFDAYRERAGRPLPLVLLERA